MFVLTALTLITSATAGGVGLIATTGAHTERVYYYSNAALDESGNELLLYDDEDDYDQFSLVELIGNLGGGAELILGDRDSKISGGFRMYYQADLPQTPASEVGVEIPTANVVEAPRIDTKHIGMGLVGLNFGIVGEPDNFLFGATLHAGAGFLTDDHTEFLALELGPHATYALSPEIRLAGDLVYTARYRKGFSHGANLYVGAQYLFD